MPATAAPPDPYVVDLERFQGPLDLLLHLIRKQDIDIFDIPISRVSEQFLAAIRQLDRLELERAGEFLELAATLVRIKLRTLFPFRSDGSDEEGDARAGLVRRLLEYEYFRELSGLLERAERERALQRGKGYLAGRSPSASAATPLESEWSEVEEQVRALLERLRRRLPEHRLWQPVIRVEEKIEVVMKALAHRSRVEFGSLVEPWGSRPHAVASLLACLELAKRSTVSMRQASPFAALWIYKAGSKQ
ncbi:MAG: segregation and condensation protein A [Longimicrobiaceae bacterium]